MTVTGARPPRSTALDPIESRVTGEVAAAAGAVVTLLGVRSGLWRALASSEWVTPSELSHRADCDERYVEAWLAAEAAAGIVDYEPSSGRFRLPPGWAAVLAHEDSGSFMAVAFELVSALQADVPELVHAFGTGEGIAWGRRSDGLVRSVERWLTTIWRRELPGCIRALEGVEAKLHEGAHVADLGCGRGDVLLFLARAYPSSTFEGFDVHQTSVEAASAAVSAEGFDDRVRFHNGELRASRGGSYDLVICLNTLHAAADPVRTLSRIAEVLVDDGTLLLAAPQTAECLEGATEPTDRLWHALSLLIGVPAALSGRASGGSDPLGGEACYREHLAAAGFTRVRGMATSMPFAMVEARR